MRGGFWLLAAVLGVVAVVGGVVAREQAPAVQLKEEARAIRQQADQELAAARTACTQRIQVDLCLDEAHRRWLARLQEAAEKEERARRLSSGAASSASS